jgi:RNA polymerase sigma-70 factor (ECF subfamily)
VVLDEKEQKMVLKAQRNPASFAPLYDQYFPKIYNYIYHRVRDIQLTEDLAGETFYRALANIGKFQWQDRSFGTWLYTIARNQIIDYFRKQKPILLDDQWAELTEAPGCNPEEKVLQDVTREELLGIIKTLTPDQQDALLLRFHGGLRLKEIAFILNKNEGAVKALLFRGLKNLRKKMEGGDYS